MSQPILLTLFLENLEYLASTWFRGRTPGDAYLAAHGRVG